MNAAQLVHTIRHFCDFERLPAPFMHVVLGQPQPGPYILSWSLSLASDLVTHLKFSFATFSHCSDIWQFLSSFPRLQFLELSNVGIDYTAEVSLPTEGLFDGVPLSALRITTAYMEFVISGLIKAADSLSQLDDFAITYQDNNQELPRLAEVMQERVKCLRFNAGCHIAGTELRLDASDISG